jgi:nucleotide-binding universal stress UspA family protein
MGSPGGATVSASGSTAPPESREALAWAGALREAIGAQVHVVVAVEPPQAFTPSVSYGINWVALEPERQGKAGELVAEATASLGGDTTGEVVVGVAYQELTELSEELDLLVLGSRAYGPVRRILLGSTSDRVVHAAACPVVVVPRGQN